MYRESFIIMKKEETTLLLKKYIRIEFGSRVFYLPRIPANIHVENNTLSIDMADMDEEYVIVDGIRCYDCVIYYANKDTVNTWLKDYTIDGMVCTQKTYFPFSLSDKEFPCSNRDPRVVVPKRDYSELTSVFLEEHKELNERVVKFLEQHPETFDQASIEEWLSLSKQIANGLFDPDCLPDSLSGLFE